MKAAIYRTAHFSASHHLGVKTWSDEKNKDVFGSCNNNHGHNYELEVKIVGEVDLDTGMVMNLKELKSIIEERVIDKLDHKNLNTDVDEFKSHNPTAEMICIVIHNILFEQLAGRGLEVFVRLYETPRNFVEYPI